MAVPMAMDAAEVVAERGEWAEAPSLVLGLLFAVALVPPFALWCGLATRRAVREDLSRGPRRARTRLLRWCAEIKRRGGGPSRAELSAWRNGVRELWRIEAAAPGMDVLVQRGGAAWGQLWDEAEAALFSRDGALPLDWLARAEEVAAEVCLRRTASPWPARARHWFPVAILALVGMTVIPLPTQAQTDGPVSAQRVERATVLMQVEKWDAAHAQWTAAFLREPRNPVVRAGLRDTLGRTAAADTTTRRLLQGRWYERAASWGTAMEWTRVAWTGAGVLSAALCVGLWLGYAGAARRWMRVMWIISGAGALGAVGGWAAFRSYGPLAHPMVACVALTTEVRPVASDVVPRAQAATLLPGTIVVIDRSFLGWDHVISADGRTSGWMRSDAAVWAYRVRDETQLSQVYFRINAD